MGAFDWSTFVKRLPERIWFRLAVFTAAALAVVAIASLGGRWLPDVLAVEFGQQAALRILEILATSMLAVTTFSLTAMIAAYSSAAQGTTPRATQLLISDRTSQNALSTFLGTFVFGIVGIIALTTGSLSEQGRSVLFIGTLVVIVAVVVTLLRWINHLTSFGRVPDVLDRVERAASRAMKNYARDPHLGGVPPVTVPDGAVTITADHVGYVTGVSIERLQELAEKAGATIHADALPGTHIGHGTVLARVVGALDDEQTAQVRQTFRMERHRTYEQDPRLGLVALSEIASRALSPALNDPGTAVDALGAMQRVLTELLEADQEAPEDRCDRVHVPAVALSDLVEDALRPVARDGAGIIEVGLRVQRVIGDLMAVARDAADVEVLRTASVRSADRAVRALDDPGDIDLVRDAARRAQARA